MSSLWNLLCVRCHGLPGEVREDAEDHAKISKSRLLHCHPRHRLAYWIGDVMAYKICWVEHRPRAYCLLLAQRFLCTLLWLTWHRCAVIVDHLVNFFLGTSFFHDATTGSFYQHQSIRVQKVFSELVQQVAADKMFRYAMEQHNSKFWRRYPTRR